MDRLAEQRAAEVSARETLRSSKRLQAGILDELAALGIPFTMVAHRLICLEGGALSAMHRRRRAGQLWKRLQRARRTVGPLERAAPPLAGAGGSLRSNATTDAAASGEELDMATLVKRTITEEYSVDEFDGDDVEVDVDVSDEQDEEEEASPSRRRKR